MTYFIEFGQDGRTQLYGYSTINTYEFNWVVEDYGKGRGPAQCEFCRTDGMFEGVFYGLCVSCSRKAGPCQCVYCRIAGVDGHKRIERRQNICKFIKTIQSAIDDLKRDYPTDEYGIVKEGIESGFYILDLHSKCQYEKFHEEVRTPDEVNQLTIGELTWRWQPESLVPDSVICSAIVAAKRSGIWEWVKKMWLESCIDIERWEDRLVKYHGGKNPANKILFCDCCDANFIAIPDKYAQKHFCPKCTDAKTQVLNGARCKCIRCETDVPAVELDNIGCCLECQNEPFKCLACNEVVALKTIQKGHCWDCQYVYCTECNTMDHILNMDERGYCAICQNPDHDQGWPKGD